MNPYDIDDILNESLTTSIVRVDRKAKMKRLVGKVAIRLAKERGDVSFDKYTLFRTKMLEQKHRIMLKYARKALVIVKKNINSNSMDD